MGLAKFRKVYGKSGRFVVSEATTGCGPTLCKNCSKMLSWQSDYDTGYIKNLRHYEDGGCDTPELPDDMKIIQGDPPNADG